MNKRESTKRNDRQKDGQVVPFIQNADFFLRRGDALHDDGYLLKALGMYRRAAVMAAGDADAWLCLAQTYAEMGCYELSNRILFGMLWRCEELPSNFYYYIGCNYIGLQNIDLALNFFRRYAQTVTDQETPEAREVMCLLDTVDQEYMPAILSEGDAAQNSASVLAEQGRKLIENGQIDQAIDVLTHAHELLKDDRDIMRSLAWTYLSGKHYNEAQRFCEKLLKDNPLDISANCVLALVGKQNRDTVMTERSLEVLRKSQPANTDDAFRAAMTFGEVNCDADAKKFFEAVLKETPYHVDALHGAACNAFRLKEYEKAQTLWELLLALIPDNPIAQFYARIVKESTANNQPRRGIPYAFQLPVDEILQRLRIIERFRDLDQKDKKRAADARVWDALLWGLYHGDPDLQSLSMRLLCEIDEVKAETLLRDFVLCMGQSDELKRTAFEELKRMQANEPFIAMTEQGIVEVRVGVLQIPDSLPQNYQEVAQMLAASLLARGEDACAQEALNLWQQFIQAVELSPPPLNKPAAFAAATEYIAKKMLQQKVTQKTVCGVYNTSLSSMRRAQRVLEMLLEEVLFET